MKILYAGSISPNDSALYRLWALERLGHTVVGLDSLEYAPRNPFLAKVMHRLAAGPQVERLNRDLLRLTAQEKPDVIWTDKLLWLKPSTLKRWRAMGIVTVNYMIDNPFGTRRDPGWRLYMKNIPFFDLHVVQRDRNIADYRARGARDVIKIQTAYEPTIHYPPPPRLVRRRPRSWRLLHRHTLRRPRAVPHPPLEGVRLSCNRLRRPRLEARPRPRGNRSHLSRQRRTLPRRVP